MKTSKLNKFDFLASAPVVEKERLVGFKKTKSDAQRSQKKKLISLQHTEVTKGKKT